MFWPGNRRAARRRLRPRAWFETGRSDYRRPTARDDRTDGPVALSRSPACNAGEGGHGPSSDGSRARRHGRRSSRPHQCDRADHCSPGSPRPAPAAAGARVAARLRTRRRKEPHDLEEVLVHVERATDRATEAVAEASSEAIRLRRALDTLPQAVLVTDERGETVFRNSKAVALIGSRHGDALAAQAVEELLAATAARRPRGTRARAVRPASADPGRSRRRASTTANAPSG